MPRNSGGIKLCDSRWGLQTLVFRIQLLSEWNTSLSINFNVLNWVWKTCEGDEGSTILLVLFCACAFSVSGWELMTWLIKCNLGPAEIGSFCFWFFLWIGLAEYRSTREVFHYSALTCNILVISHSCLPYLPSRWVHSLLPMLLKEMRMWVNPGIHLFVSGVDQEHVGWVQDFLL